VTRREAVTALTGRRPGRPKDPELEARRRGEILDAAVRLFAEHGYSSTDVQVLADGLGVGKGTVYRYFPSKRELFLAAVDRGLEGLSERIDAALAAPGDPLDRFVGAVRAYLEFFHERPEYVELFLQERAEFRDRRVPLYFARRDDREKPRLEFLQTLFDSGRFRKVPPDRVVTVMGDLLYGTIFTNYMTGRVVPPAQQAAAILDVVFRGLLSDRERKRKPKS
jgi:AcrR family transcriptional regulator